MHEKSTLPSAMHSVLTPLSSSSSLVVFRFDAPIGYISITATYTKDWKQWWRNPDNVELVQFMGKDNIPFRQAPAARTQQQAPAAAATSLVFGPHDRVSPRFPFRCLPLPRRRRRPLSDTVMFPASLMAAAKDYTLLHHVSCTEYLQYEGAKFSKVDLSDRHAAQREAMPIGRCG